MKRDPNAVRKQAGTVTLATKTAVGNATIPVSAVPFPLKDTTYYQVGAHGDYQQESGTKD
jgi:hypothetical protein